MSHDIIIIISDFDGLTGGGPNSLSASGGSIADLRGQAERAQVAWAASVEAGNENHEVHRWLESVQAWLGAVQSEISNLSSSCPVK